MIVSLLQLIGKPDQNIVQTQSNTLKYEWIIITFIM